MEESFVFNSFNSLNSFNSPKTPLIPLTPKNSFNSLKTLPHRDMKAGLYALVLYVTALLQV